MLKYKADLKTLVYMVITTALIVVQWRLPKFNPWLFTASLFMAAFTTVIAHNHNHTPIWTSKLLNTLTDYWLTLFYGYPAFAWIPTHNMNHHRFNNREGDYTITYRVSESNNIFTLLSYPTISAYFQQRPTRDYLKMTWQKNRERFWLAVSQYVVLIAYLGILAALDWKKALLYAFIPQQFGLTAVLIFNYLQHVHADEESQYNHSRNIVGPMFNFFMFNNGFHTVHHDNPNLHWSKWGEEHKKIAHLVDPSLQERSFWWLIIRTYFLGPIFPSLRSRSMRLARMRRKDSERVPPGIPATA